MPAGYTRVRQPEGPHVAEQPGGSWENSNAPGLRSSGCAVRPLTNRLLLRPWSRDGVRAEPACRHGQRPLGDRPTTILTAYA